jgi:HK97 family phage major capsid protein
MMTKDEEYTVALKSVRDITEKLQNDLTMTADKREALKKELDVVSKKMDEQEKLNQDLVARLAKSKEDTDKAIGQIEMLEKQLCRMGSGSKEYRQKSECVKALQKFAATGQIEKSYMRTDNNVDGGFLVTPEDLDTMIIKPITEVSRIRQYAKNRRINTLTGGVVKRDVLVQVYGAKEGTPATDSMSTYSKASVEMHRVSGRVIATQQLLLSGFTDIEAEIQNDMIERFAQWEGAAFVNGTGVNEPFGFMNPVSNLLRVNSGVANSFTYDSLIDLAARLKTGYDPMYGFSREVSAHIRKLKDGNGQYIWQQGNMAAGYPNAINGYPYIEIPDMPGTIDANTENVIFADFRRMYEVVDAFQAFVIRDIYGELASNNQVAITMHRFIGGHVILAEAGVVLKNAV